MKTIIRVFVTFYSFYCISCETIPLESTANCTDPVCTWTFEIPVNVNSLDFNKENQTLKWINETIYSLAANLSDAINGFHDNSSSAFLELECINKSIAYISNAIDQISDNFTSVLINEIDELSQEASQLQASLDCISNCSTTAATSTEHLTTKPSTTTPEQATTKSSTERVTTPEQATTKSSTERVTTPEQATTKSSTERVTTPEQATTKSSTERVTTPEQATTKSSTERVTTPEQATTKSSTERVTTPEQATTKSSTELVTTPEQATTQSSTEQSEQPTTTSTEQPETSSTSSEMTTMKTTTFASETTTYDPCAGYSCGSGTCETSTFNSTQPSCHCPDCVTGDHCEIDNNNPPNACALLGPNFCPTGKCCDWPCSTDPPTCIPC